MFRSARALVSTVASAVALAVAITPAFLACEAEPLPCKVDTDCPEGDLCRDERCGPAGTDAGASDAGAGACASENAPCTRVDECCSRVCDNGRCGVASGGTSGSSGSPGCVDIYGLCSGSECCSGLSCTNGTCR